MLKVFCFYISKPFREDKFAKVYPELEPSVIRHIDILEKKQSQKKTFDKK